MTSRDLLETQVLAAWTSGVRASSTGLRAELQALLTVYSDALQSEGSPRGELIALDLNRNAGADADERRRELLATWVGSKLGGLDGIRTRYGLLSVSLSERTREAMVELLAGAAGHYVEHVGISGDPATVQTSVAALLKYARPWLGRIHIAVARDHFARTPVLDDQVVARMIAATPALHTLELTGHCIAAELAHPRLLRLVATGYDSVGALSAAGRVLPALEELDLAFQVPLGEADPSGADLRALLPSSSLPALRRLDLSRNEPGYEATRHLGGDVNVFEFLRERSIVPQLTHLRMPSLRRESDGVALQQVLDSAPLLAELEVSSNHIDASALRHATAVIAIPRRRCWPPRDELAYEDRFEIELPIQGRSFTVPMVEGVIAMERAFDELPEDVKAIWDELWMLLHGLPATETVGFSLAKLERALAACADYLHEDTWRALRAAVAESGRGDDRVVMRRP